MIGHVGDDRVLLGSDYPYDMAMLDCVDARARARRSRMRDKTAILHGTARSCCPEASMNADAREGLDARFGGARPDRDCMLKVGVPASDAAKIAELMLEADLIGADAHGVFRLPQYVQRLKLGSTNPRPNITVERTAPATALVHGDNGMGHLVVSRARGDRDRTRARKRHRLGRLRHVGACGRRRRLRRAAAARPT